MESANRTTGSQHPKGMGRSLTPGSQRRTTNETSEESQDGESGKVGDKSRGDLKHREDGQSNYIRNSPSDRRDLCDRSEEQGSNAISSDKQGKSKGDRDLAEVEVLCRFENGR